MKTFLQVLPIYVVTLAAQFLMSWGSYTFIFSRIKLGTYELPFWGEFSNWWTFTIAAWLFASILYVPGTIMVVWAIRWSLQNSGMMYPWAIAANMIPIITTIFFMWYRIGELPNRNGIIALALIALASVFAAFSGKN